MHAASGEPAGAPSRRRAFQLLVLCCLILDFFAVRVDVAHPWAGYFEWVLIGQVFVLWPLAYMALVYPLTGEKTLLLASMGAGMLFGGLALDASWKQAWRYVDQMLWVLAVMLAAIEVAVMAMLLRTLHGLRRTASPERAIADTVRSYIGDPWIARLITAEFGMWFYVLLSWRPKTSLSFDGTAFFTVHRHQGNAVNQKGFLWLIGTEIPIAHVLLGLWYPKAAWIVTALSVYAWLWMLGQYRATLLRPVSMDDRCLHLRYGLLANETIPLEAIVSVEPCSHRPRRRSGLRRYLAGGVPNACLKLRAGTRIEHAFGASEVDAIVMAVDEPARFIASLKECIRQRNEADSQQREATQDMQKRLPEGVNEIAQPIRTTAKYPP